MPTEGFEDWSICKRSEDGHCDCWWDDEGPCCRCGDDTDAGQSDDSPRAHLGYAAEQADVINRTGA